MLEKLDKYTAIGLVNATRRRTRTTLGLAVLIALLVVAQTFGQSSVRPADVIDAVLGGRGGDNANGDFQFITPREGGFTFGDVMRVSIATQLSTLPIASASAGVLFQEDTSTGVLVPSRDGLGPIFSERAETIGKGRWYAAITRQQFQFANLESADATNFRALNPDGTPLSITGSGLQQPLFTSPITSGIRLDLRLDQNVGMVTYGLTRRLDVSATLTSIQTSMELQAFDGVIHSNADVGFGGGFGSPGTYGAARATRDGLGDTTLRVKGMLLKRTSATLSAGVDVRLPTGKALDFHGVGTIGAKPFVAISFSPG